MSDVLLNCVNTYMWRSPELMQLLIGMSTMRYLPPSGTAGFERSLVSGNRRVPAPPPMMIARDCLARAERLVGVIKGIRRTHVEVASSFCQQRKGGVSCIANFRR